MIRIIIFATVAVEFVCVGARNRCFSQQRVTVAAAVAAPGIDSSLRGFARCLLEGSVLPFFKDLIPHLCDRPSSLSKQVCKVHAATNRIVPNDFVITRVNSGSRQQPQLWSKHFSSLASHPIRLCMRNGSSSQGGCCPRYYRGLPHLQPFRHYT